MTLLEENVENNHALCRRYTRLSSAVVHSTYFFFHEQWLKESIVLCRYAMCDVFQPVVFDNSMPAFYAWYK
jgi:hypothetical protein